ncbi:hypothetical protein M378DRAFT_9576 [Amanita muscaria Koide BX008]|uniref:Uncharacterized protein n=1 Tax=Amanita muscaria (strain Koide BX008) TaxID=946122 RepID=A0A0C2WZU3_AMAMK|nr:hypothetical protein M378DRAFT_9576 [Amanita muscaria Koide BX008]
MNNFFHRTPRVPPDRDYHSITSKRIRLTQDEPPVKASVSNNNASLVAHKNPIPASTKGTVAAETADRQSVTVEEVEDDQNLESEPPSTTEGDKEAGAASDVTDVDDEEDADGLEEETPEAELKRLQKDWTAPIYAFFKSDPIIMDGAHTYLYAMQRHAKREESLGETNMRRHAKICWGEETIAAASGVDMRTARKILKEKSLSRITAAFDRAGKGTVTSSNRLQLEPCERKPKLHKPTPPAPPTLSRTELLDLFHQAIPSMLNYGDPTYAYEVTQDLYKYCAMLRREQLATSNQTTLDAFLGI